MVLEESCSFGSSSIATPIVLTPSNATNTNTEGSNSQVETDNSLSTLILGKRKRTAKYWEHFNIEQLSSGKLLGTCKYCNKQAMMHHHGMGLLISQDIWILVKSIRNSLQIRLLLVQEFASYAGVDSSKNEVDRYLRELVMGMYDDVDVLNNWKESTIRFPILSSMARDILAIPITTVASESTFSMGGCILNKWRSSLLPINVNALVTSKHWLTGYDDFKEEGLSVNVSSLSDNEENE